MPLFANSLNLSLGCCPEVAILCTVCFKEKSVGVPDERSGTSDILGKAESRFAQREIHCSF